MLRYSDLHAKWLFLGQLLLGSVSAVKFLIYTVCELCGLDNNDDQ